MGKTIAIIQSNYIPWKGYFDLINGADEVVIYDDCQYTKNDWRNRNRIKATHGLQWLTIPVCHERLDQKINETQVADNRWRKKHWSSISQAYSKTKFFSEFSAGFQELYADEQTGMLSDINLQFIRLINEILGISTRIRLSSEFELKGDRTEKLLGICKQCEATAYLSGPAARSYFDQDKARKQGLSVYWMVYSGYKPYAQHHGPFEHAVSVLDLIFNTGRDAPSYMKSFSKKNS